MSHPIDCAASPAATTSPTLWRIANVVAAAIALAAPAPAAAQPVPRSYAVVSEVARHVNVVQFQQATGTRLEANQRSRIPMPDGVLDKVALLATRKALNKADAGTPVWLIAPMESDLFPLLQNPAGGDEVNLPDDLAGALRERGSTDLLVLTRHRGEAEFQEGLRGQGVGNGEVDGLGFFLDNQTWVRDPARNTSAQGFIVAYAYFRVTLVNVATRRVVASHRVRDYELQPATRAEDGVNAWTAMSSTAKVNLMRDLLEANIAKAVPGLLAGR